MFASLFTNTSARSGNTQTRNTRTQVERFFQLSLLGLVTSGFLALAGSGYLDLPTLAVTFLGLAIRGAIVAGFLRVHISPRDVSWAALAYIAFFPFDFYFLSRDFLHAVVHGVCFLALVKVLTVQSNRDYIYTGVISFMELVAAALIAANSGFFGYLALYVVCAIAVFTSAEIRYSLERSRRAGHVPPVARGSVSWRLAVLAVAATAGILVLTAGLFLSVPRTARMAALLLPGTPLLTGFSNEVDLGGFGRIARDDRPVMHVLSDGRPLPNGLYWRGAALSDFDGMHWRESRWRDTAVPAPHSIAVVADRQQLSRRDGHRMLYRVEVQNSGTGALFIAGIPEFIHTDARYLLERPGESFRMAGPAHEVMTYQVSAHTGTPLFRPLDARERERYLQFPPIDLRIVALAREWAGNAANPGTDAERALRIQTHLRRDFKYKLDGPAKPVRDPLADFLFVRKEGYCEYFASAMAVMLRAIGIPARVATGFYGGYFNDVSGLYVVRASDAHAWVEAWIEGVGWRTFDPTPGSAEPQSAGVFRRLNMYFDAMDHAWHEWVVSYDPDHQAAVAARLEALLHGWRHPQGGALSFRWNWKWAAGALAFLAAIILGLRIRRTLRPTTDLSEAGKLYARMLTRLARRGFHKPHSATPTEFARQLPEVERSRVAAFTETYNAARFGGDSAAAARLALLLKNI